MMTELNRRLSVAVLEPQPIMVEGLRATMAARAGIPCSSPVRLARGNVRGRGCAVTGRSPIVDKCCAVVDAHRLVEAESEALVYGRGHLGNGYRGERRALGW